MFQIGQQVVVRSSGISRTVTAINEDGTVVTTSGINVRTMKASALCTSEEYAEIHARYVAKMNKKFGRR